MKSDIDSHFIELNNNFMICYKAVLKKDYTIVLYNRETPIGSYNLLLGLDNTAFLDSFIIFEAFSNNGYSKYLIKSVYELGKLLNIQTIFLDTIPYSHESLTNDELVSFYQKNFNAHIVDTYITHTALCFDI